MTVPIHLCEYPDGEETLRLEAVVDEVTLTYTVIVRDEAGETRPLRRHLPALRTARRWAHAYAAARERSSYMAEAVPAGTRLAGAPHSRR